MPWGYFRVEEGDGKRRGEGKVQSRVSEDSEELKGKRLKEMELTRAEKGEAWGQRGLCGTRKPEGCSFPHHAQLL